MTMWSPDNPTFTGQETHVDREHWYWSPEDDNWLRDNYVARGAKECAERLRRTPHAVRMRMKVIRRKT